jgi:hypothetical protein
VKFDFEEAKSLFIGGLFFGIFTFIVLLHFFGEKTTLYHDGYKAGYKQCQIDNNIKNKLATKKDGSQKESLE